MKRFLAICLVLSLAITPFGGADDVPAKTHQVRLNGHTFTLPLGFEVELVATAPQVEHPVVADFDEQGRLYVAEVNGAVTREDVAQKKPMHRILRLEDSDGDGRFDKSVVFADKVLFTEGTMWLAGSLYIGTPPSIWKLTDTDGDGVADKREEWFKGKTLTGCANDLHGPYRGPDGWIYWCKGAFAQQEYKLPNGKQFTTRASHIFRSRPDGTGIEPVMTGGMDNPVDVTFTPGGERIFTTTFFQHPAGGKRDGLIHAIYGGVYGKDHDVVYDHKWTGPSLMPVLTHMGPAAPCGLTRYESHVFGKDYRDNLFACQFNMHKVSRHILEPEGATFKSHDENFLVSDNLDFHPTDVIEDADGSLLVIDTGGWYKLCCPSSQLHKPDVRGAIYRVRKAGTPKIDDPRGNKIDWAKLQPKDLAGLLADTRPVVQRRAIEALGRIGVEAVSELVNAAEKGTSPQACRNAVWASTRIADRRGRSVAALALADKDETVRQAAIHSLGLQRFPEVVPQVLKQLRGESAQNRRAAAEALGRIGDKSAVAPILEALAIPSDRVLEHSLIYALIEIGDREETAKGLTSQNVFTRRAALIALDQMDGGKLEARTVAAELNSRVPELKDAALWIVGRHPEWGTDLAGFLRERLSAKGLSASERDELVAQLARFAKTAAMQSFLAEQLRDAKAPVDARRTVLRAMGRASLRQIPNAWLDAVNDVLNSDETGLLADAAATVRSWPAQTKFPEKLVAALLRAGANAKLAPESRLAALAAVPGGLSKSDAAIFAFLRDHLGPDQQVPLRAAAADVLSRAKLSNEQLLALADALKSAGPMELDRLLEAFTRSTDEKVGLKLLESLSAAKALSSLRADAVRQRLTKYNPAVQKKAESLYAVLNADEANQKAKLEGMLSSLKSGDIRRGQAAFMSTKAACSSCHAIGYLGGKIGPDLTRIGQIRTERDLLESIVFPSMSFVRSYEPVRVATKEGKVVNGLLKKDAPDELIVVVSATEEVRIPRDDVEEVLPSKVSIMPAGLDQQLSLQELADLVAFLRACR